MGICHSGVGGVCPLWLLLTGRHPVAQELHNAVVSPVFELVNTVLKSGLSGTFWRAFTVKGSNAGSVAVIDYCV